MTALYLIIRIALQNQRITIQSYCILLEEMFKMVIWLVCDHFLIPTHLSRLIDFYGPNDNSSNCFKRQHLF